MTTPEENAENLSPAEQEAIELYAFLDGELDADSCARIESRLMNDPAFAARMQRLEHALGVSANIVRDDADRIYATAKVDTIADRVMEAIATPAPVVATTNVVPIVTVRSPAPRKAPVVWIAFGAFAAAAAAVFFLSQVDPPKSKDAPLAERSAPVASPSSPIAPSTAAPTILASASTAAPSSTVQIDDLEVGEGASVIYSGDGSTPAVVWVHESREGALQ